MTTTTWTGTNGNWTDTTWTDGVPNSTLDAIIDGTSASPDTVTFATPSGAAHSLSMSYATLAMASGTLTLENSSALDALSETGGLLDFAAGGHFAGPVSQSAGTIEVDSGALLLEGTTNSLAGTVSGSGELELYAAASTTTLQSGLALAVANFTIGDGSALLGGNISDAGAFTLASPGTLLLNGDTFTASGTAQLGGLVDGPGTLLVSGTADANGLTTQGTATIRDTGLITEDGNVFLAYASGTDQGTLSVAAGGTWDVLANVNIYESGTSTITNDGLFEKTGGTGQAIVEANLTNTGTVSVTSGTLQVDGHSVTNTGLIDAAAGDITFASSVTNTNLSSGTLTGGTWKAVAGTLSITGGAITTDAATIFLSGAGSELSGGNGTTFTPLEQSLTTIAAGAELWLVDGRDYTTSESLNDQGFVVLFGGTFSDSGTLIIALHGHFVGSGTLSAPAIKNSGKLVAAPGSTLVVAGPVTSTGSLVAAGTLDLAGAGNVIYGKIFGPGLLELGAGSSTTIAPVGGNISNIELDAGATLTMGRDTGFYGTFSDIATGGTSTLDLDGHSVIFSQSTFSGPSSGTALIEGGSTLTNDGTMTLNGAALDGGTTLGNSKHLNQTGLLALGDTSGGTAFIKNLATGTYTIAGTASLSAASATADRVRNAGLFEKTGSGTAIVGAAFTNTGTIEVIAGTLEITAAFTNTGTIIGTETQSGGTTYITAPAASQVSVALFNQYSAAIPSASSASLAVPPATASTAPTLTLPHAA